MRLDEGVTREGGRDSRTIVRLLRRLVVQTQLDVPRQPGLRDRREERLLLSLLLLLCLSGVRGAERGRSPLEWIGAAVVAAVAWT